MGIFIQIGGGFAHHFIGQNRREAACKLPALEEHRPIEALYQFAQVDVVYHFATQEAGFHRLVGGPIDWGFVGTGLFYAHQFGLLFVVLLAHFHILVAHALFEGFHSGLVFLQQLRHHAHQTRGIQGMHGDVVVVIRLDFHGGVGFGCGRAAHQQWDLEVLTLHLFGDVAHFFQAWGNQT